jgi:hypothetical protein
MLSMNISTSRPSSRKYSAIVSLFAIDIETCRSCGGRLRVIASIESPALIERILEYLGRDAEALDPAHPSRAPPQGDLLH